MFASLLRGAGFFIISYIQKKKTFLNTVDNLKISDVDQQTTEKGALNIIEKGMNNW